MFVLLARDKHAPTLIWLWASLRELDGEDPEKVKEARECVVKMLHWAYDHGRSSVGLGQAALAAVLELIRTSNANAKDGKNAKTTDEIVRHFLAETKFEGVPETGGKQEPQEDCGCEDRCLSPAHPRADCKLP